MEKILCYLYDEFVDFEVTLVLLGLREKFEIIPIADYLGNITAKSGMIYAPQKTTGEFVENLENIAGILIPGGSIRADSPNLSSILKKLHDTGKFIGAICAGPEFLAKAGLLEHRKFTTTRTKQKYLDEGKKDPFPWQNYVDKRMVHDQNVITATGSAFIDFTLEIWEKMELYDTPEEREELRMAYTPLP